MVFALSIAPAKSKIKPNKIASGRIFRHAGT